MWNSEGEVPQLASLKLGLPKSTTQGRFYSSSPKGRRLRERSFPSHSPLPYQTRV